MKEEEPRGRLVKEKDGGGLARGGVYVGGCEGECCGCCHLWTEVPADPSSWQAVYSPNSCTLLYLTNTVQ